jgi:ATP-dependent Lhr-like helicase
VLPTDFHPIVRRWWAEHFCETEDGAGRVLPPTPAQLEGWQAIRRGAATLIAAPTGSGKTLAAFLTAIDQLLREGLERGELPDEVRVVYVSPLKALSADIHKNLAEPRREIRRLAAEMGYPPVKVTAAARSGDTPQSERAAMLRMPPHILVTTPESLYLLLTARRSREMLRTAQVVIVDEIHALLESRRGAHLALSLERLDHVCGRALQRIGLSATQKPIEEVARFLTGQEGACTIVNQGHRREIDLAVEVPGSPLEAVMSAEVWLEIYNRLVELIETHRTTLIMVNTRRLAERMAHQLSERLGAERVAAHHGSLAKEIRLSAEERLRGGKLKVMVSTASLELGIDIGHVDLVCQISSPNRIATLLQRIGRSGHTVRGLPKGRLFPLTRDDLVECAAMVRAAKEGELDRVQAAARPLDVLAQQIVAEVAAEEWDEERLYARYVRAYPYRELTPQEFEDVVGMLGQGYTTKRGRRGALIHYDAVNRRLRSRRGSRMIAITSGGAIPEVFDYRVVLEPEGHFVGTLNEDFAIESLPGDIFQLGNTSWRILRIGSGVVRVADAQGQPPSMPFWLGEAPARSDEMSAAVSRLRAAAAAKLPGPGEPRTERDLDGAVAWLTSDYGLSLPAAEQIAAYLGEGKRGLGALPTADTLVIERFFDESGGMQLCLHAPFGSRVNRAWGLALRKRFCQSFNFELQAAATEEGLIVSLGPCHSFPLADVFRYLHPSTVREILVQAVLASPIFETRWRWTTTLALAVPRNRNGARLPAQIQRMYAEDLLQGVFPDAVACQDNLQGMREVPDHPLVNQALRDCLEEAMDLPRLTGILERMHRGEVRCLAIDTPEPSVLSHELLNSAVYTFLDDAPLEERRTQAVYTRRASEPRAADDLGALDPAAIERVRAEAWPVVSSADELHDALLLAGFIREREAAAEWRAWLDELVAAGRAHDAAGYWVAIERCEELHAVLPQPSMPVIPERLRKSWERGEAARELTRGRMEVLGPVTARRLADDLGLAETGVIDGALLALETEGRILRGRFTPALTPSPSPERRGERNVPVPSDERSAMKEELEWCDRRLLARIHRYTLNRLRAEIEAVNAVDFMRFLLHWQHVATGEQVRGTEGLAAILEQLDGYELAAAAWEHDVLPARVADYGGEQLDALCLSGRVAWGRLTPMDGTGKAPLKSSPIALMMREHAVLWRVPIDARTAALTSDGSAVHDVLATRGASFFHEIVAAARLLPTQIERALGELAGAGLATADSFSGLRALLTPPEKRKSLSRRRRSSAEGVDTAGRWALLGAGEGGAERVEAVARALLKRYGVVFRAVLARESRLPPWRDLALVYRRLEARGEIRGGRFVAGFGGEQFALPEAVGRLRAVRKLEKEGDWVTLSAADPLNLAGVLSPGARVAAISRNRVLYCDGLAIAALEGGELRRLADSDSSDEALRALLTRRAGARTQQAHFRTPTRREMDLLAGRRPATFREANPAKVG